MDQVFAPPGSAPGDIGPCLLIAISRFFYSVCPRAAKNSTP
jgi:hypothetical protein